MYILAKKMSRNFGRFIKWVVVSGIIGIVVGLVGTAFSYCMKEVTSLRQANPHIVLGLPVAGLFIVWLYKVSHKENDRGTNTVLAAVRADGRLTFSVAPLIFICTLLTHLFGGSAGREGAALQMGGSIGNWFGKLFRMNQTDMHVVVMCGMSACFSALFGTPMAAAVFSMEVVSVGIMHYAALVPCAFASLVALGVAQYFGVEGEAMTIADIPQFDVISGGKILLLAMLFAIVSMLFCVVLHWISALGKQLMPNSYIRIFVMGALVVGLHFLLGTDDYMGAGMEVIERCMQGEVYPGAFLLKILLTALTLGAGYKGGEIVPSFYVGATFGCLMGKLVGLSPSLCAAVGMVGVFCGVTNCPITSLLIALELFGMDAFPFFLLGIAVSYMLSGYYSLYEEQRILYSKYRAESRHNS